MPSDLNKLIPELKEFQTINDASFSVQDWMGCVGNYEHAIGYMTLFWPDLYEYEGCIFVDRLPDEAHYKDWLKSCEGDKKAVEAVLNHVHIIDFFNNESLRPTKEQVTFIGRKLKEMWLAKAKFAFPEKNIKVIFYEGEDYDLTDYEVTLYQESHKQIP